MRICDVLDLVKPGAPRGCRITAAGRMGLAVVILFILAARAPGAVPEPPLPAWLPWQRPAAKPHPAVARVLVAERDAVSHGSGTLVAVDEQHGLVVTNWHVVRDGQGPIAVVFPDGFQSGARILGVDRDWDLAALLIWRPPAGPVTISSLAPRPGDRLTIAGYGSGDYRAVAGTCTQYVAPGTNFPYEMVELSAQARQGDSGGPIFNEQGELAGVLFGAGSGTTSGSYCGRVRWFLDSVWPRGSLPGTIEHPDASGYAVAAIAPATPAPPAGPFAPSSGFPAIGSAADRQAAATASQPPLRDPTDVPAATQLVDLDPAPDPSAYDPSTFEPAAFDPSARGPSYHTPVPLPRVAAPAWVEPGKETGGWRALAGSTPFEQAKSILAVIGVLAMVLQFTGTRSRK